MAVKGGRPPIDPVLMFKVLVIQTINARSDERTEYLINDRLSFMRFLGLGLSDRVPDAKTIWLFRERLTKAGAIATLFERFDAMRPGAAYIAMSGQILDASLVAAPLVAAQRQRNTPAETRTRRSKSVVRSRVEHVFADQKSRMGLFVCTVGIKRAEMKIGLANLVYNIRRFLYPERINAA